MSSVHMDAQQRPQYPVESFAPIRIVLVQECRCGNCWMRLLYFRPSWPRIVQISLVGYVNRSQTMTITTRSKRLSAFGTDGSTPTTVAPGSYAPEQVITSFGVQAQRPLFSSFATSEKRNLNENKTTSAITPGLALTWISSIRSLLFSY
ncbi:hypothetical protein PPTG_14988 [Phytophthora nicotianae INRA-310]|uniref:Uncharacterized protein n=1 Tax=Phytophthora nicotianae (strain INRA-310) TaxID=761204 RepID=W2PTM8_PHYN3|nr:hypothetical protein PPTG_14988 [Phytophthora nicotianae INRA-310]ETN04293.1 hypothetical protein PPTG_14988 [Phytophthora nicotianae INRA-310]